MVDEDVSLLRVERELWVEEEESDSLERSDEDTGVRFVTGDRVGRTESDVVLRSERDSELGEERVCDELRDDSEEERVELRVDSEGLELAVLLEDDWRSEDRVVSESNRQTKGPTHQPFHTRSWNDSASGNKPLAPIFRATPATRRNSGVVTWN